MDEMDEMDAYTSHDFDTPEMPASTGATEQAQCTTTEVTFESSLSRLEEIVSLLGSGRAPLAQSLALFEEGTTILRFCNEQLEEAEGKVALLTADSQGSPTYSNLNFE